MPSANDWYRDLTEQQQEELRHMCFGGYFGVFYPAMLVGTYQPSPYRDMPQELADQLALVADKATEWFHNHRTVIQLDKPEIEPITDQQVRDRIQGFQYGMDREIARCVHFQYDNAWNWRFDDDWREQHQAWVDAFNQKLTEPAFAKDVRTREVWRYDLSAMPWQQQYNLCVRWQQIWHSWKEGIGGASGDRWYDPEFAAALRTLQASEAERKEADSG